MAGFIAIVTIAAAVLQIILFFKIWGMTNDVDKLKKKFVDHSHGNDPTKQCRKLLLLGRKEEVREIMISLFFDELEQECDKMRYSQTTVMSPYLEELRKQSIAPYVSRLESNLKSIGETLPKSINNIATFGDYMDLVKITNSK